MFAIVPVAAPARNRGPLTDRTIHGLVGPLGRLRLLALALLIHGAAG